jgi:hypothetical protein
MFYYSSYFKKIKINIYFIMIYLITKYSSNIIYIFIYLN